MSLGYAEKLSYKEDIGTVGMSEIFDPPDVLQEKIEELASMIAKSKHLVVFTGAGISTSCGIPDFRGPKGVWTLQREGKGVPSASLPFHRAMPSLTHMALVELERVGILKLVISQKFMISDKRLMSIYEYQVACMRSIHFQALNNLCPILERSVAELTKFKVTHSFSKPYHDNNPPLSFIAFISILLLLVQPFVFIELTRFWISFLISLLKLNYCQNVDSLHLRSGIPREKLSELHGNSFRELCPSCGVEYVRDFEVETIGLKETSRRCSDEKCGAKLRDTVLDWEDALPAKEMSLAEQHCKMADIVLCLGTSLQITPACNLPMRSVRGGGQMVIVNLQQTPKDKKASLVIHGLVDRVMLGVMNLLGLQIPPYVRLDLFQVNLKLFHRNAERKYVKWTLRVASVHGQRAQLPFLSSVEVSFPERPELKPAILHKQPFLLKREMLKSRPVKILLSLHFGDGCGCSCTSIEFTVDFQVSEESFKNDKDVVLQKLRHAAIQDWHCGQLAVIERETLSSPRTETTTYAVVTSIVGNKFSAIAGNGKLSVNCKQNGLLLGSNIKKRRSEVIKRDEISQKQQKVY